jgi:hypothetical protein
MSHGCAVTRLDIMVASQALRRACVRDAHCMRRERLRMLERLLLVTVSRNRTFGGRLEKASDVRFERSRVSRAHAVATYIATAGLAADCKTYFLLPGVWHDANRIR